MSLTENSIFCLKNKKIESSLENWETYCAVKRQLRKIVDKKKQLHFQTLIAAKRKSIDKSFSKYSIFEPEKNMEQNLTLLSSSVLSLISFFFCHREIERKM